MALTQHPFTNKIVKLSNFCAAFCLKSFFHFSVLNIVSLLVSSLVFWGSGGFAEVFIGMMAES